MVQAEICINRLYSTGTGTCTVAVAKPQKDEAPTGYGHGTGPAPTERRSVYVSYGLRLRHRSCSHMSVKAMPVQLPNLQLGRIYFEKEKYNLLLRLLAPINPVHRYR